MQHKKQKKDEINMRTDNRNWKDKDNNKFNKLQWYNLTLA